MRQHARPGDITIDLDQIAQALGSPVTHGHDRPIRKAAADARDAAIRAALTLCQTQGATAWIIDSRPTQATRARYLAAGARFTDLTAPAPELHRRASLDNRPASWHARIDQYLAGTDPPPQTRTTW